MFGSGDAILTLVRSKHALWIGLIFVFSAAFAREYDAEYIPRRPWVLLVPLGASLVSSFLLWVVLWFVANLSSRKRPPFWANYRAFLGLFWLTAPLAWLYAIPVERFLEPGPAVYANYALLGVVAAWRVFLMIRVAQVFTGRTGFTAATVVLLFGDAALLLALMASPWPVIEIMSGARRSEVQAAHLDVIGTGFCWAVLGLPLLMILAMTGMIAAEKQRRSDGRVYAPLTTPSFLSPATRSLWVLTFFSLLVWTAVLPFTQPPLVDQPGQYDLAAAYADQRREWWTERTSVASSAVVIRQDRTLRIRNRHGEMRVFAASIQWRKLSWKGQVYEFKTNFEDGTSPMLLFPASDQSVSLPLESLTYREGRRDFATTEELLAWVKSRPGIRLRYTSEGLACDWDSSADGRSVAVEVWQLTVQGREPEDLSGADDADIDMLR